MSNDRTSPATPDAKTLLARVNDWLREPDYAEVFSLVHLQEWMERRPISEVAALTAGLAPTPDLRATVVLLAERFWSIHPKEIQDMGITRQQFYEREMLSLVASPDTSTDRASTPNHATPEMVAAAYAAYGNDEVIKRADDWLEAVINAALAAGPVSSPVLTSDRTSK